MILQFFEIMYFAAFVSISTFNESISIRVRRCCSTYIADYIFPLLQLSIFSVHQSQQHVLLILVCYLPTPLFQEFDLHIHDFCCSFTFFHFHFSFFLFSFNIFAHFAKWFLDHPSMVVTWFQPAPYILLGKRGKYNLSYATLAFERRLTQLNNGLWLLVRDKLQDINSLIVNLHILNHVTYLSRVVIWHCDLSINGYKLVRVRPIKRS